MLQDLKGRTALITGGARRIGRETALALAAQGANVVIHFNRSEAEARELQEQLERGGVQAWRVQADFGRSDEYETLIDRAWDVAGRVDILINNASVFPSEALATLTWNDLLADIEVNAWVPLTLSRRFAERLGRCAATDRDGQLARGSIVNLHDTHLEGFDVAHAGYILSKHVLAALTRMLAYELAPNVTVNAVAPGLILPPPGAHESYLRSHAQLLPLQRHGEARDIAEAIVFLIRSDFITGQVIYVDGGRHLEGSPRDGRRSR